MNCKLLLFICMLSLQCPILKGCGIENQKAANNLEELVFSYDSLLLNITNSKNTEVAYRIYIQNLFNSCTSNYCLIDSINKHKLFYKKALNTFNSLDLLDEYFIIENNTLYSINIYNKFYRNFLAEHDNKFLKDYFKKFDIEGMLTPMLIYRTKYFNDYFKYNSYEERLFVLTIFILISNNFEEIPR